MLSRGQSWLPPQLSRSQPTVPPWSYPRPWRNVTSSATSYAECRSRNREMTRSTSSRFFADFNQRGSRATNVIRFRAWPRSRPEHHARPVNTLRDDHRPDSTARAHHFDVIRGERVQPDEVIMEPAWPTMRVHVDQRGRNPATASTTISPSRLDFTPQCPGMSFAGRRGPLQVTHGSLLSGDSSSLMATNRCGLAIEDEASRGIVRSGSKLWLVWGDW